MTTPQGIMRVAAVGDLHYPRSSPETLQALVEQASAQADVLLLCGDLTDYGRPEEARLLAKALTARAHMPMLAVLGNHDYESGQPEEVRQILCDAGITMLDGEECEIQGLGFAGVKGFAGGFGQYALLGFAVHRYMNVLLYFISSTYEKPLKGTSQNACIYVDGIKARQYTTFCLCLRRISLLIAQKCILQIKHVLSYFSIIYRLYMYLYMS